MSDPKTYYRRHLPHYQPEGKAYHVVFRLAGSIPANVLKEFRCQREQEEKRIAGTRNESEKSRLLREYRWKYFEKIEGLLDGNLRGPVWLRTPEIAGIVDEAIHYWDQKGFVLIAHSIMPNHAHMVFELLPQLLYHTAQRRDGVPSYKRIVRRVSDPTAGEQEKVSLHRVTDIIGSIKKYSGLRANRVLGRHGAFWHDESYDHVIRDAEELDRTIWYVLMNPVKAELCKV